MTRPGKFASPAAPHRDLCFGSYPQHCTSSCGIASEVETLIQGLQAGLVTIIVFLIRLRFSPALQPMKRLRLETVQSNAELQTHRARRIPHAESDVQLRLHEDAIYLTTKLSKIITARSTTRLAGAEFAALPQWTGTRIDEKSVLVRIQWRPPPRLRFAQGEGAKCRASRSSCQLG